MKKRTLSLRVDKPTDSNIMERIGIYRNPSEVVRQLLARYFEIVRRHQPDLTSEEWQTLEDCLVFDGYDQLTPNTIAQDVKDGDAELSEKLRSMLYVERVAIVDVLERSRDSEVELRNRARKKATE